MIRRWFIMVVLCAISAVLLWDFVTKALLYDPMAGITGAGKAVEETPPSPREPGVAWGAAIVKGNLFSEGRGYVPPPKKKPPPPPVKKEEPVVIEQPPNFVLNGIIINQTGEYVAYINKEGESQVVPLRKGDSFSGAMVTDIKERSVELIWKEETITLYLKTKNRMRGM